MPEVSKELQRYFFSISYRGSAYHGWQRQPNALSVQEVVEDACEKLWPGAGSVTASGRTDTGVHCIRQYFHLDVPFMKDSEKMIFRLNRILPNDIAIGNIIPVIPDAHARFSALNREYIYLITTKKDVFRNGLAYYYGRPLDIEAMNEAAAIMRTFEDFQSFSKVNTDVNHFLCTIGKAEWNISNEQLHFEVSANRFLRGMVRAMVGTLLLVGRKKIGIGDVLNILESRDRSNAGSAAPPEGLYLRDVTYPEEIFAV